MLINRFNTNPKRKDINIPAQLCFNVFNISFKTHFSLENVQNLLEKLKSYKDCLKIYKIYIHLGQWQR